MTIPLTDMFDKVTEDGFRKSPPGMAHWAGTGPKGKVCRQCIHYTNEGRYSLGGKHPGWLKPGRCTKFGAMMRKKGPTFPIRTLACKHFEENPNPPTEQVTRRG